MSEAFFVPASGGDSRFTGQDACTGPWSPELMHGGPPSALLVRACERVATDAGEGLVALRAGIDFLSAVPVGEVEVSARVVRAGRRITLTEGVLLAGGREVLHARTWHVRVADLPALGSAPQPADPTALPPAMTNWDFPYGRAMEWRAVSGDPEGPGDAAAWGRARIPVVEGEEPTGLQRAVLTADSGNGISAALDWGAWSFVNIDLDVHLARPLEGDWVLLDATSRYERSGTGMATSQLSDVRGPVGRGAQTLVVTPADGGDRPRRTAN
jgi:hypothetical protein